MTIFNQYTPKSLGFIDTTEQEHNSQRPGKRRSNELNEKVENTRDNLFKRQHHHVNGKRSQGSIDPAAVERESFEPTSIKRHRFQGNRTLHKIISAVRNNELIDDDLRSEALCNRDILDLSDYELTDNELDAILSLFINIQSIKLAINSTKDHICKIAKYQNIEKIDLIS